MVRKILLMKEDGFVWTYLLEDAEIVEIHCAPEEQSAETPVTLGNIYIGKVQNIVANIGAAFIDIGGINCYYDISQAEQAVFTAKNGRKPLGIGDELLVQISREAVKTKAPTVTSNLSFTGRFAVLTSGNTRIGVSSKIPKALREEFKERLKPSQNEDYGIIVRTNAKDAPFEKVISEIESLKARFYRLKEIAGSRTCFSCLESAPPAYITDLKNVYIEGLTEILVEDEALYGEVYRYFEQKQPEQLKILRLYQDKQLSLSACYNMRGALKRAVSEQVWLKSGGYLVIQPTEALTVIDVNSGKCISKKKDSESYLKINLEAAREIARQLRLRNLSGIIIVDFINMDDDEAMQQLLKELRIALSNDPIQANVVDVTELQLVELTRKKIRKPLYECYRLKNHPGNNFD